MSASSGAQAGAFLSKEVPESLHPDLLHPGGLVVNPNYLLNDLLAEALHALHSVGVDGVAEPVLLLVIFSHNVDVLDAVISPSNIT